MINIFRFLCFIFLISIVFWYFEWKNSKIYQADQLSGYEKDSIIYSQNFEFKNSKIYQFYQLSGYEKEKIIYSQNYEYVINNNVAQYSSYIIEEKSDALYRIKS
jgi:hypothetical protein